MKKIIFSILVGIIGIFIVGCGSKSVDYGSYNGQRDYGAMNNSKQVQSATMRPYQINGKWYYPTTVSLGESHDGIASWYGPDFHGKKTSNGETYSMYAHTAAHKTFPMNTIVRVTSMENGKSTVVRINDRGPFVTGRIIDLSNSAAKDIDMLHKGTARVRVEVIGFNGAISDSIPLSKEALANTEYKTEPLPKVVQISRFMVQIGAFRNQEGAKRYQQSHNSILGYTTVVREFMLDSAPIYRVMLTGFQSEAEARDFIAQQKIAGSFIVTE